MVGATGSLLLTRRLRKRVGSTAQGSDSTPPRSLRTTPSAAVSLARERVSSPATLWPSSPRARPSRHLVRTWIPPRTRTAEPDSPSSQRNQHHPADPFPARDRWPSSKRTCELPSSFPRPIASRNIVRSLPTAGSRLRLVRLTPSSCSGTHRAVLLDAPATTKPAPHSDVSRWKSPSPLAALERVPAPVASFIACPFPRRDEMQTQGAQEC